MAWSLSITYTEASSIRVAIRHFRSTNATHVLPLLAEVKVEDALSTVTGGWSSFVYGPEWFIVTLDALLKIRSKGHPAKLGALMQTLFTLYEPDAVEALWRLEGVRGIYALIHLVGDEVPS